MSKMLHETYARFEDRFRGSRDAILQRLRIYEPLLSLVRGEREAPVAVDYGCGRGEWLEILRQAGWQGRGFDTNVAMLAIASQHGLQAERADALAHLERSPSGSVDLISAFHLVEHLPIETLLLFIREALRVLRPEGVLLLETPNPENLLVGTCNFYLDPTHERPIPPMLLNFLVEDGGAHIARVVRLNGEVVEAEPDAPVVAALRPMFTTAFDYAVIGSRSTDVAFVDGLDRFVAATSQPSPVDLSKIAAIDAAGRHAHDANVAAIAATHVALGQQGELLQHTTDRLKQESASTQVALAQQAAHLQATTDRMAVDMDHIRTRMTEEFAHEEERRDKALAQVLVALEARLAPIARLPKFGQQLEHLTGRLDQLAGQTSHERELEAQLRSVNAALQDQARLLAESQQREAALNEYVGALMKSRSWRVTRPLRALTDLRDKLGKSADPAGSRGANAAKPQAKKKRSIDPHHAVMIEPDPDAVAVWQALLASTSNRKPSHASVD